MLLRIFSILAIFAFFSIGAHSESTTVEETGSYLKINADLANAEHCNEDIRAIFCKEDDECIVNDDNTVLCRKIDDSKNIGREPVFESDFENVTANEGSELEILCSATAESPLTYLWYNEHEERIPLNSSLSDSPIFVSKSFNGSILNIKAVNITYSGIYTCSASNNFGLASKLFQLTVIPISGKEPSFDTGFEEVTAKEGSKLEIICSAMGEPPLTYLWYNEHSVQIPFTPDSPIFASESENGSILNIKAVKNSDGGAYICSANNSMGLASKVFELKVSNISGNCLDSPCQNGGTCNTDGTCSCFPLTSGEFCELLNCDPGCEKSGGSCVFTLVLKSAHCSCSFKSFNSYLKMCEESCITDHCKNGGACIFQKPFNTYCSCLSGTFGSKCELMDCSRVNPQCKESGGLCVYSVEEMRPTCKCSDNQQLNMASGKCEEKCPRKECRNGGRCTFDGQCTCLPGTHGIKCEKVDCDPACEQFGGRCVFKVGERKSVCICPSNYIWNEKLQECEEGVQEIKVTRQLPLLIVILLFSGMFLLLIILGSCMCWSNAQMKKLIQKSGKLNI